MVKKISRKVDISAIEEGLHEKRTEERLLGTAITEKKNEDLFFVDIQGDSTVSKSLKQKRLKIDEILTPNSKYPALEARKVSKKESNAVSKLAKKIAKQQKPQPEKTNEPAILNDIWADSCNHISLLKPPKDSVPKDLHPGMSYKPHPVQHNDLIMKAANVEFKKLDEAKRIEEQLSFPEDLLEKPSMEEEANNKLFQDEDSSEEEQEGVEEKRTFVSKPSKRKTKAERNKEKKQKAERQKEEIQKKEKAIVKQIDQVLSIKKLLKPKATASGIVKEKKKKIKVKDVPIPIKLTDEVPESLRLLRPEGNLLKDQFVGFQKKALIEPRNIVKKPRQKRTKEYEKRSYKYIE